MASDTPCEPAVCPLFVRSVSALQYPEQSADPDFILEARTAAELLRALYDRKTALFDFERQVFVVAPHHRQKRAVRFALRAAFPPGHNVPEQLIVDTVEKMQGQEADVVFVLFGYRDPVRWVPACLPTRTRTRARTAGARPQRFLLSRCCAFLQVPSMTPKAQRVSILRMRMRRRLCGGRPHLGRLSHSFPPSGNGPP